MSTVACSVNAEVKGDTRVGTAFKHLEAEAAKLVQQSSKTKQASVNEKRLGKRTSANTQKQWKQATFGNGCFWCTEAVFEELQGVRKVASGYSGGRTRNPTYKQVCSGFTGHAEVIHLEYDPSVISYAKLLEVFWRTHDPTTLNQQGADIGTQYRSAVFFHDEEQQQLAMLYKKKLNDAKAFGRPVVTEVVKFTTFYPAEKYHQDYYALNGKAPYCRAAIEPKLSKFRHVFADELARNPKNIVSRKSNRESQPPN